MISISLLQHAQRDEVAEATRDFTCRGKRHKDDETCDGGDEYIKGGLWADLDERGITRTWAAIVDGVIGGYIALAADAVMLSKEEKEGKNLEGVRFSRYGCTQIVMVATRADLQERDDVKVGQALMDHAVLVGRKSGEEIGARFLAADVNPPAVGFYEQCGFIALGSDHAEEKKRNRGLIPMVLDLAPAA